MLADWLLGRRDEALARFGPFPPPEPVESKPIKPEKAERARLREALLESGDEAAGLVAQLLDYHERERKPVWWAMFDKAELTPGQLLEDREAIGGLRFTGESWPEKKSTAYAFTYPPQEQKIGRDPLDQATLRGAGDVLAHDTDARRLELKRGRSLAEVPLPQGLLPGGPYLTKAQEAALERIGRSLLEGGGRYPAIESVLRRAAFDRDVQTNDLEELTALLQSLGAGTSSSRGRRAPARRGRRGA